MIIHDLKHGQGTTLAAGDVIEVHYHVAPTLRALDTSPSEVLQSSWRDGIPLTVALGYDLRPDLSESLIGVRVGTDRRYEIPPGTWDDVTTGIALSLSILSLVERPVASRALERWEQFDRLALPAPPRHTSHIRSGPHAEVTSVLAGLDLESPRSPDTRLTLIVSQSAATEMAKILSRPEMRHEYQIEVRATRPDGLLEVSITLSAARRVGQFLGHFN